MTTIQEVQADMQYKKDTQKEGYACAQISAKLKITVTQSGPAMGGEVSFEGDGKGKIDAYFAVEEGILVLYKQSHNIDGQVTVTGAQELEGTISVDTDTEYKLSK